MRYAASFWNNADDDLGMTASTDYYYLFHAIPGAATSSSELRYRWPVMYPLRMAGSLMASSQRNFATALILARRVLTSAKYFRARRYDVHNLGVRRKSIELVLKFIFQHSRQAAHLVSMRTHKDTGRASQRGKDRRVISPGNEQLGVSQDSTARDRSAHPPE